MSEKHHSKVELEAPLVEEQVVVNTSSGSNLIPASIVIGAILISASVFYNTGVLIKELKSGTFLANQTGTQQAVQQQALAPEGPVDVAERDDAPTWGKSGAKVTLVEFSDFQCPFCQRFYQQTFSQLKSKYVDSGKAQIVFRHYPLPFHQNAQKAAEAAECANKQGKFAEYHDILFEKGTSDGTGLAITDLKKYADDLGLNHSLGFKRNQFNECLDSGEMASVVSKDMSDGQAAGVSGTPTVFVNGKRIVGAQPLSVFEQAIEEALK
jgi:protein-disulfide isomerase